MGLIIGFIDFWIYTLIAVIILLVIGLIVGFLREINARDNQKRIA